MSVTCIRSNGKFSRRYSELKTADEFFLLVWLSSKDISVLHSRGSGESR